MIENQRYARNAELRKKKDRYEPYAEDIDEFGLVMLISLIVGSIYFCLFLSFFMFYFDVALIL